MQPVVIDAGGTDRQIGRAHALGALALRPAVADWVRASQATHPLSDSSVRRRVEEVVQAWQELTPATLEQVSGMVDVYEVDFDELLVALLATYLKSGDRAAGRGATGPAEMGSLDGCTTLAITGPNPLLAKNRDNDLRFLNMQTVLRVEPERGHRWLALTTAGAPGVHSSGMNELGLCVADTHVPSTDIGPGMPRFAAMMHVLERFSTTAAAVEFLTSTPQMGLGTITVLDEGGQASVVECGFRNTVATPGTRAADGSAAAGVAATNHYTHPLLSSCNIAPEDGSPAVSSLTRRARVDALLSRNRVDRTAVLEVLSSHIAFDGSHGQVGSVCAHGPTEQSETISTVVLDAVGRHMDLSLGRACNGTFSRIPVLA